MGAADGDFGFLGVVHAELVAGFEPRHDFADVLDVDDEGAVGAPEGFGVELLHELFEGAAVGVAFDCIGDDADGAVVDGGEADFALIDEQKAALGADDDATGLGFGGLGAGLDDAQEGVELGVAGGVAGGGFGAAGADFVDGLEDAGAVEGFEEVVDGVEFEGSHRVLIVGGGKDDVRQGDLFSDEALEDGEAIEAGHLDVEEDDIGLVGADKLDGFDAIATLGDYFDALGGLEEVE